ncbi:hypothetical protein ACHAXT_002644 [Thalassiosira profunda]
MGNSPSSPRRRPKRERLRSPPPPGGDSSGGGDDVRADVNAKTVAANVTNGDAPGEVENGRAARREADGSNSSGGRRPKSRNSDGGRGPRNSSDNANGSANRRSPNNSSSANNSSASSSSSPPSPRSLRRHRPPPNRYVARPSRAGWNCADGDAAFLMDRDDGAAGAKERNGEKGSATTNGGGEAKKRPASSAAAAGPSSGRGGKSPHRKTSPAKMRAGTKGKKAAATPAKASKAPNRKTSHEKKRAGAGPGKKTAATPAKASKAANRTAAKADRPAGKGKSGERGRASPRVWLCPQCRHINLPDRARCRECRGRREGEGDEGEGDAGRRSSINGHEGGAGANSPGKKRAADAKSPGKKGAEPASSRGKEGGETGASQKRRRRDSPPSPAKTSVVQGEETRGGKPQEEASAGHITREEAAAWEAAGGWQCQICRRLNLPSCTSCQGCGASRMTTKDGDEADEGATTKAPREAPPANAAASNGAAAGKAEESDDASDDESNYDDVACALCKCAVDWADADYFLPADAEDCAGAPRPTGGRVHSFGREDDSMRSDDSGSDSDASSSSSSDSDAPPFRLPRRFHDPANALVLCDGPVHADDEYACDRAYHQQCHFVPILSIPRGPWRCLVCRQWDEDFVGAKKKGRKTGEDRSARPGALRELFRCRPAHAMAPTASAATASGPTDETAEEESRLAARERDFELRTGPLKAKLLRAELFTKSKAVVRSSFATLRSAAHALRSLTETPKARKALAARIDGLGMPQELAECVLRRATAKMRVRELIGGLEDVIRCRAARDEADEASEEWPRPVDGRGEDVVGELMRWYLHNQNRTQPEDDGGTAMATTTATAAGEKSLLHHLFPEGHARRRRLPPRTGEANRSSSPTDDDDASDDSGVSLDDLACWVCHGAHATDENDMLLCDGRGCYRAFHMQCLEPRIGPADCSSEDDDWFCPLCAAHGTLIHYAEQEHRLGDDRAEEEAEAGDDDEEEEWECAADIFPEAPFELRVARKFKEGQRDRETDAFLADTLGIASKPSSTAGRGSNGGSDEDDEDDDDFDHEEADGDDAESLAEDRHEEARLGKESIGKDELDNLSVGSSDEEGSDDEDASESGGGPTEAPVRRRKRRRGALPHDDANGTADADRGRSPPPDAGTLDVANIVRGPRRRATVDYRKLADAMFGDESDEEAKGAAREYTCKARDFSTSDNEGSDGDDGDGDDDSGEEEEDAPKKKKARRSGRG